MAPKRRSCDANLERQGAPKKTKISPISPVENGDEGQPLVKSGTAQPSTARKSPAPSKQYKDTIEKVDTSFDALVRKYKPNPNGFSGITADDFAKLMARFLPTVRSLSEISPATAFNLLLDLGEHAYGDLNACMKSSGFGDTEEPYKRMDELLVEIINMRREVDGADADGATTSAVKPYVVEPSNSDLGGDEPTLRACFGKKHPNKQQWKQLDRARLTDLKTMFNARRARRDVTEDWAGNALNDLLETGGRIGQYGIGKHFFYKSIGLLASIKGVERSEFPKPVRIV